MAEETWRQGDIEGDRLALSLRGAERVYGISRAFVAELVRTGELPAIRRGRAIKVLRADLEAWWRRAGRDQARSREALVRRVVEREGPRKGEVAR